MVSMSETRDKKYYPLIPCNLPLLLRVSVRNSKFTGKKVHIKKINLNFSQQISGIYVHAYINNEFALKIKNEFTKKV